MVYVRIPNQAMMQLNITDLSALCAGNLRQARAVEEGFAWVESAGANRLVSGTVLGASVHASVYADVCVDIYADELSKDLVSFLWTDKHVFVHAPPFAIYRGTSALGRALWASLRREKLQRETAEEPVPDQSTHIITHTTSRYSRIGWESDTTS